MIPVLASSHLLFLGTWLEITPLLTTTPEKVKEEILTKTWVGWAQLVIKLKRILSINVLPPSLFYQGAQGYYMKRGTTIQVINFFYLVFSANFLRSSQGRGFDCSVFRKRQEAHCSYRNFYNYNVPSIFLFIFGKDKN